MGPPYLSFLFYDLTYEFRVLCLRLDSRWGRSALNCNPEFILGIRRDVFGIYRRPYNFNPLYTSIRTVYYRISLGLNEPSTLLSDTPSL